MAFLGQRILEGMGVTLKHFVDSYVEDYRRWKDRPAHPETHITQRLDFKGIMTVNYPEEQLKVPERFRALPVLIYEEEHGEVRCTSCGICAKVCPPQCIWIVQAKAPDGKIKPKPAEFFIDMDVCMNCGYCSEFCPFDAIKMDHNFEMSNSERDESHVFNLQDLLVSTEYYARTHPIAWAEEQEVKRQKEEAKKKAAAAKLLAGAAAPPLPGAAAKPPIPPPPKPAAAAAPKPAVDAEPKAEGTPPAGDPVAIAKADAPAVAPAPGTEAGGPSTQDIAPVVKAEADAGMDSPGPVPAPETTALPGPVAEDPAEG